METGASEVMWEGPRGIGTGSKKERRSSGVNRAQRGSGVPGRGNSVCLELRKHVGGWVVGFEAEGLDWGRSQRASWTSLRRLDFYPV